MKKFFAILLAALMIFALCACGNSAEPAANDAVGEGDVVAQIANPMAESDADGVANALGIALNAPEGADNVKYFIITGTLGEVQFDYNKAHYNYRAQKTDEFMDISGVLFTQPIVTDTDLPCTVTVEEDGSMGTATWYADGFSYAVSMDEGATVEALTAMYIMQTA